MKKFMFTADEIDRHTSDIKKWHHFVRSREAEIAFSLFPATRFHRAIELGAGDGGQSATISTYCDQLICTERDEDSHEWLSQSILKRKMENVTYELCDAQDLSRFKDNSFDLVFSSNMLEHIPDVNRCLLECQRVLKNDGVMLHTMPSRWWKLSNAGIVLLQFKHPSIHGVSKTQWDELYRFGAKVWKKRIESIGLRVTEIIGLPFYSGHGNTAIPFIKAGNALRIPATCLYVIRKE
jgi:ubiquinone/menaquinone biosynthesis C-methylase UbiE